MHTVPNSGGEPEPVNVDEANACHSPKDGKFCSGSKKGGGDLASDLQRALAGRSPVKANPNGPAAQALRAHVAMTAKWKQQPQKPLGIDYGSAMLNTPTKRPRRRK